jgi:VanZ family protein
VKADRRRLHLWAPVVVYMALIFAISSNSRPPDLPSALGDKGGHALLYFGLGLLFVRALAGGWREPFGARKGIAAAAYSILYAATDEIHQMFVPPRTAEIGDLLADAAGAIAAVIVAYAARAVRMR